MASTSLRYFAGFPKSIRTNIEIIAQVTPGPYIRPHRFQFMAGLTKQFAFMVKCCKVLYLAPLYEGGLISILFCKGNNKVRD